MTPQTPDSQPLPAGVGKPRGSLPVPGPKTISEARQAPVLLPAELLLSGFQIEKSGILRRYQTRGPKEEEEEEGGVAKSPPKQTRMGGERRFILWSSSNREEMCL